jgi:exopolysaccharide biosynthesis polyprenyl glycosylphosphotransferase
MVLKKRAYSLLLIGADFLASFIAWPIFYHLRKYLLGEAPEPFTFFIFLSALGIALGWLILYASFGFYFVPFDRSRIKDITKSFTISLLGATFLFFVLLLDDSVSVYTSYYKTFLTLFFLQWGLHSLARFISLSAIRRHLNDGKLKFRTLIIGSGNKAAGIYSEFLQNTSALPHWEMVAYVPVSGGKGTFEASLRPLGTMGNLHKVLRRCRIDQVIVALENEDYANATDLFITLEGSDVRVFIIPDIYQLLLGSVKVSHFFDLPIIEISQDLIPIWQKALKRGMDLGACLIIFTLGLPFLIVVALITKWTSKGPIFYTQERIGKGGRPFTIIKFRSMYVDAESRGPALASDYDNRITPWGRFMRKSRIDEFPQFINVLIGDMSLVGPRPERQYFIDQIMNKAPYYRHLHRVRPGITSLGQVKFGYAENVEEMIRRLKYDILYIENMSLNLDLKIVWLTIQTILLGKGK